MPPFALHPGHDACRICSLLSSFLFSRSHQASWILESMGYDMK